MEMYALLEKCSIIFTNIVNFTTYHVNKNTGLPGEGIGDYSFADQERIFTFNWYNIIPPSPEDFEGMNL
jgi:hypothetical protein